MIYPYKYLKGHSIGKLHKYIEFFFDEMYKRKSKQFSLSVIHTDFIDLARAKNTLLLTPMKSIYKEFKALGDDEQKFIYKAFKTNNSILSLCNGYKAPLKYSELGSEYKDFKEVVKSFFADLYTEIISKNVYDSQIDHFIKFRKKNGSNIICPFCGLMPLLSKDDGKDGRKDDYDHWLSKGKYPFNSVNFRNLVIMCGHCNQKYKSQKDTLYLRESKTKWKRRKVFYPYNDLLKPDILVSIDGKVASLEKDNTWQVKLDGPPVYKEEIESWNAIFDIKDRYRNKIKERYKKVWYEQVVILYKKKKGTAGFDFNGFRTEIYNGLKPFHLQESSIIEKAYYDYLFSDADCEKNLKAIT